MSENAWTIWTYALVPGWENGGGADSREAARDVRDELIEHDGYPPEFVAIRRTGEPGPQRRPPLAVIRRVHQAIAAGADR